MTEDQDDDDAVPPSAGPGLFESLVQDKPIAALIGAVVIGFLLGRLVL